MPLCIDFHTQNGSQHRNKIKPGRVPKGGTKNRFSVFLWKPVPDPLETPFGIDFLMIFEQLGSILVRFWSPLGSYFLNCLVPFGIDWAMIFGLAFPLVLAWARSSEPPPQREEKREKSDERRGERRVKKGERTENREQETKNKEQRTDCCLGGPRDSRRIL